MPGMKVYEGFRVVESLVPFTFPVDLPDLTDPATLGCLLALVREAWGDPKIHVVPRGASVWATAYAGWLHKKAIACGATEAEALVAALEGAP